MPGTLSIPVNPPVTVDGGGTIDGLTLRELTGLEVLQAEEALMKAGGSPAATRMHDGALLALASGVSIEALKRLPVTVTDQALRFVSDLNESNPDPLKNPPPQLQIPLPDGTSYGGATFERMTLQEPLLGQVWTAEAAFNEGVGLPQIRKFKMLLAAQVSGIPYAAVEKLPVSLINQAAAYCRGFRVAGPQTGVS